MFPSVFCRLHMMSVFTDWRQETTWEFLQICAAGLETGLDSEGQERPLHWRRPPYLIAGHNSPLMQSSQCLPTTVNSQSETRYKRVSSSVHNLAFACTEFPLDIEILPCTFFLSSITFADIDWQEPAGPGHTITCSTTWAKYPKNGNNNLKVTFLAEIVDSSVGKLVHPNCGYFVNVTFASQKW